MVALSGVVSGRNEIVVTGSVTVRTPDGAEDEDSDGVSSGDPGWSVKIPV